MAFIPNFFFKKWAKLDFFLFIFVLFSHRLDKYSINLTINDKSIDGMLGSQTRVGKMEGHRWIHWAMAAPDSKLLFCCCEAVWCEAWSLSHKQTHIPSPSKDENNCFQNWTKVWGIKKNSAAICPLHTAIWSDGMKWQKNLFWSKTFERYSYSFTYIPILFQMDLFAYENNLL